MHDAAEAWKHSMREMGVKKSKALPKRSVFCVLFSSQSCFGLSLFKIFILTGLVLFVPVSNDFLVDMHVSRCVLGKLSITLKVVTMA